MLNWKYGVLVIGMGLGFGLATACDDDGGNSASDGDTDGDSDTDSDADSDADADMGDLGTCTGTPDECEAARLINAYRANHIQEGECNEPLKWNAHMGELAHDWQQSQKDSISHSDHGYVENVGYAYGLAETVNFIIEYDPDNGEDHCAADGSYVMSHHCAAMFCANKTVGVGIYEGEDGGFGKAYYITMMFGGADGEPDWGF